MKYTEKQKAIRKMMAKNLLEKRKLSKDIKAYCMLGMAKRKINSIFKNIDYLIILTNKFKELEKEQLFLYKIYINN